MEPVSKCFDSPAASGTTSVIVTTVLATIALQSLIRYALWPSSKPKVIPGPLATYIPKLSQDELKKVTYHPDYYPGARDVTTPYGNIRVYEFGPEDGRKVLFIHGISTTCMTLQDIARPLAEKGCRVMLFDLFGRGYTDAPGDLEYDTRLWVTQILLVLASSKLPWTGENGLNLVGYSLGGGIAANFAATFPHMVQTLILLAPSGVIRPENIGRASRLIFTSGIIPERLLGRLTKWRLKQPIDKAVSKKRKPSSVGVLEKSVEGEGKESFIDAAEQEAVDPNEEGPAALEPTPFERTVESVVHWTLDHHEGFVPAFMSTIRFAPLMDQHGCWRQLAARKPGTTAVLLGRHDQLIQKDDYVEDALPLLGGEDNVFWRVVPGAHNFPFTNGPEALECIYEFWGMKG
ncbi:hypothetical protein DL766_001303 [Monosporascus sp. MC13-8B]|uniref:AB hydrolase-1 domain-containing protein n=1 Tax=Monosporascus cannonballus TaxID=155416 RepID=A0ABY0GYI1_9PEZI|nr:hypothetical protein DL762_009037 [Monosporascus cannonballus]RYO84015.1 hypothetical protein DL763_007614 [Monosporascus cannonballus]RYP37815.1 hypothetical protein DL766_001303 [Monosporascus sp. MC13-8B]